MDASKFTSKPSSHQQLNDQEEAKSRTTFSDLLSRIENQKQKFRTVTLFLHTDTR